MPKQTRNTRQLPTASQQVRWKSLAAILTTIMSALLAAWFLGDLQRQNRVELTYPIVLLGGASLLLWLAFSNLSKSLRWRIAIGLVIAAIFLPLSFTFNGFTGDLVPMFAPRWSSAATRSIESVEDVGVKAADFPQFMGPSRRGTLPARQLATDWTARPPIELWRRPIGEGWSGFAVLGDIAVTQEQSAAGELVTAMALRTGETLWSTRHDDAFESSLGGNGPRSTPTLSNGRAYAVSALGKLSAFDLNTGTLLWSHAFARENAGTIPEWGFSGSPLLLQNAVVINAGAPNGSLIAYDRESGEQLWAGGTDEAGYSSPILSRRDGIDQIVSFNKGSVTAHSPIDGHVLWNHPWSHRQPNVAQPAEIGDNGLLISSGYGVGAELLEIAATGTDEEALTVSSRWQAITLKSKFSNYVEHDGFVYGLDEGIMVCVDPLSGKRQWKGGRYGHGQMLLVGDLLLLQGERGEVFLIAPDPSELRELSSFRSLPRKAWNTPALAGNVFLVRNHQEATAFVLPTT